MNGDLVYVKKWLLANKLSLNVVKTEFLLIGSHYSILTITAQPSIGIGHNSLKQVTFRLPIRFSVLKLTNFYLVISMWIA